MEYKIIKQRYHNYNNTEFIASVQEQFGLSELSATYLIRKGFSTLGQIEEFLYPKTGDLFDPYLFSDMRKACDRIYSSIEKQETIAIYGDYDCDGICASVILYKTLKFIGADVIYYLPDRFSDGYGFSEQSVRKLYETGAKLIISVDNGITAHKEIELANDLGINVIITDHHICPEKLPFAYAIINPKNKADRYPYSHLCGSGVAYKLASALCGGNEELLNELLVFAALATVADMVPLTLENRAITYLGISLIKERKNLGLTKLIESAGIDIDGITSGTVSYHIAPRINACGRLYKADIAVRLFLEEDPASAESIAEELNSINDERRQIETDITQKADDYINENNLLDENNILIIKLDDANEGVIGVACGKICEKYHCPAIICVEKDGVIKGSARSVAGFDIYNAMLAADDLYIKFGGHPQAAGLTIAADDFDEMCLRIKNRAVLNNIKRFLVKSTYYDIEAVSSYITEKAVRELALFSPYGIQNPNPVFRLSGVNLRNIKTMGAARQHLRFNVLHKFSNFNAVAFFMADTYAPWIKEDQKYDILFNAEIDNFRANGGIKLIVKEIVPSYECSSEYYKTLYNNFKMSDAMNDIFNPSVDTGLSVEAALDNYADSVYVVHGKDVYLRTVAYAEYRKLKTVFTFDGSSASFTEGAVNVIVNPLKNIKGRFPDKKIVVLDPPCFSEYSLDIYGGCEDIVFLNTQRYIADIVVNRDYIAFVYKRLRALDALGGDIEKFISYLNTESEKEINYFTLRICLDIMCEMEIIEYELNCGKLELSFIKISKQKDVNVTPTMLKLNGTAVRTEG